MGFAVADITPGAIIVQVNMAVTHPGDVAFWNSHMTVGVQFLLIPMSTWPAASPILRTV